MRFRKRQRLQEKEESLYWDKGRMKIDGGRFVGLIAGN